MISIILTAVGLMLSFFLQNMGLVLGNEAFNNLFYGCIVLLLAVVGYVIDLLIKKNK